MYFGLVWFFVFAFRSVPVAHGSSQVRGLIGATLAGHSHSHSNKRSSLNRYLHHSSWQHHILNLLSEARDRTCILVDTSWIRFP